MNSPALQSALCACSSPLLTAPEVLVGQCAPCVKRAALSARTKPLIWDYLPGSHRTLIAAVSYEGDEVEHATYRWDGELEECNGRLHSEAVDALRNDLESGRHMYRGDVPRQEKTPRVSEFHDAADHGEVRS